MNANLKRPTLPNSDDIPLDLPAWIHAILNRRFSFPFNFFLTHCWIHPYPFVLDDRPAPGR